MAKVFISYSSQDADFAELCQMRLKEAEIDVWLDQGVLSAGDDWRNAIDDGLNTADAVIVLLSPHACASAYVTYEWAYALGRGLRLIPLLLSPCQVHPRLESFHHMDFCNSRARPWERLFDEIRQITEADDNASNEQEAAVAGEEDPRDIAKARILEYLDRKGFNAVSFKRIRSSIDPTYENDFLMDVVRRHHNRFRLTNLQDKGPGLRRH